MLKSQWGVCMGGWEWGLRGGSVLGVLFPCEGKLLLCAHVFTGQRVTESQCKRQRVSQDLAQGLWWCVCVCECVLEGV